MTGVLLFMANWFLLDLALRPIWRLSLSDPAATQFEAERRAR